MIKMAIATVACLVPLTAAAQSVGECDWKASAWNVAEPWSENAATFANGNIRIAVIDTIEPGAAAFHLLVLSPPWDELGGRQCRLVSGSDGLGFAGLTLEGIAAAYDPSIGLSLRLQHSIYNPDTAGFDDGTLVVIINQATGGILAYRE